MKQIFCILTVTAMTFLHCNTYSQDKSSGAGVAVSPTHLDYGVAPGEQKSRKITINNDTDAPNSFRIRVQDFEMDQNGGSVFKEAGTGSNSLSKFLSVSPSFVELKPGEKKDIVVNVKVPFEDPFANKASWCVIMVEQAAPKKQLDPSSENGKTIALGVIPTFAFGVWVYQNPPNADINAVEIMDFKVYPRGDKNFIQLDAENRGDGIAMCRTRVELINNDNGESVKLPMKNFTIVPGLRRQFKFVLPPELSAGNYTAVGIVDYGSDEEILTAELEFQY